MNKSDNAIVVKNLQKSFKQLHVLRGINFAVPRGSILGILGPNGAGKTTTIRILSTLLLPDDGQAKVNGYDVVKDDAQVRASIGLTGQYAAVDEYLTGKENLEMMGRLYHLSHADTKERATHLLEQFDLVEASVRPVRTYSGGMRRRLDLAMSLIASPPIIFLDEPTTGLDPRSRNTIWRMIKDLAKNGTTILLTTQYMEEADQLADKIVVIDNGKVIAEGTAAELKKRVGSDRLEIAIGQGTNFEKAKTVIDGQALEIDEDRRTISLATKGGVADLKDILQKLESAKIAVDSISMHSPTLDDVFLTLTGRKTAATKPEDGDKAKGKDKKENNRG
jgi:ABC-2 type transport system ATP-binding protein